MAPIRRGGDNPVQAGGRCRRTFFRDLCQRMSQHPAIEELLAPFETTDGPGLVVGVRCNERIVHRRGYGLASVALGVALVPTTRMRIASVSKQFTALACLLLADDGRLDLDQPVGRYLPDLANLPGHPTIRQFLGHTSGLRCTLELGTLANGFAHQPAAWQRQVLGRQRTAHFEPGRAQIYNNGTYHVLSDVVEAVSGISFEDFLSNRIFQPLGLHDTESLRDPTMLSPRLAALHVGTPDGGWQIAPSETELRGDGGMISSIDDLLRWLRHLRNLESTGQPVSWRALLEPTRLSTGVETTYTLGLKRHAYRGTTVLHHSGGLVGLSAQVLTVPDHSLDIVIISNGARVNASRLSWEIVDVLLADQLEPPLRLASSGGLGHLGGRSYRGPGGFSVGFDVDRTDGHLGVSLFHLPSVPVFRERGTELEAGFEDLGMGPYCLHKSDLAATAAGEPPRSLCLRTDEGEVLLTLLPAIADDTRLWAVHGRYVCEELRARAEIAADGTLSMQGDYGPSRPLTLRQLTDTEAIAEEQTPLVGRYSMSFKCQGDCVEGFWIDSYRARRIWFQRLPEMITR
mgnify:CR=1 FL=1